MQITSRDKWLETQHFKLQIIFLKPRKLYLSGFCPKLSWHSHPDQNATARARTPARGETRAVLWLFCHSSRRWRALACPCACFPRKTSSLWRFTEKRRGVSGVHAELTEQRPRCLLHSRAHLGPSLLYLDIACFSHSFEGKNKNYTWAEMYKLWDKWHTAPLLWFNIGSLLVSMKVFFG